MVENRKFIIDGEVKERYYRYGYLYVVFITGIINATPVILMRFEPMKSSIYFMIFDVIWYLWLFISLAWIKKYQLFGLDFKWMQVLFPVTFLNFILARTVIFFLKRKYPNTYDENEILKFNRKIKIKNIL